MWLSNCSVKIKFLLTNALVMGFTFLTQAVGALVVRATTIFLLFMRKSIGFAVLGMLFLNPGWGNASGDFPAACDLKADAGNDVSVCLGDRTPFDASASLSDPSKIVFAKWKFGDGVSEGGLKVIHVYDKPGIYTATLTLQSPYNTACRPVKDSKTIVVNSSPRVTLSVAVQKFHTVENVLFTATATDPDHDPLDYFWSFGDGQIIRGRKTMSHIFEKEGPYKITVAVDDGQNSPCSSNSDHVTIEVAAQVLVPTR